MTGLGIVVGALFLGATGLLAAAGLRRARLDALTDTPPTWQDRKKRNRRRRKAVRKGRGAA